MSRKKAKKTARKKAKTTATTKKRKKGQTKKPVKRRQRGDRAVQVWVRLPVEAYREIEDQAKKHYRTIPGQIEAMISAQVEPLLRVRKLRKELEKMPRPLQPEDWEIERNRAEAEKKESLWQAVSQDMKDAFLERWSSKDPQVLAQQAAKDFQLAPPIPHKPRQKTP